MAGPSILVRFLADTKDLQKASADTQRAVSGIKASALKTGAAIGGAFATAKVVEFGKASIDAAREAQVSQARLAAVFKNVGDASGKAARHANDYAESLGRHIGVDPEVIKGGQAILATFHSVSDVVGRQAGIFDRATAAAADLAAAGFGDIQSNSVQLGKALEDPIKGITALARSGVNFTDAQKQMIKSMVESGNRLGAQKIVLANVESQVKGTAAATATSSAKMKVAWGQVQEAIGRLLLPVVSKLADKLAGLFSFVEANSSWLVPVITGVVGLAAAFIAVAKAVQIFKTAAEGMRLVWALLNIEFLASPLGLILTAVALLAAGIYLLATRTQFFQNLWRGLVVIFQDTWNWLRANWPYLLGILLGPFGLAIGWIIKHWDQVKGVFVGLWRWLQTVWRGVTEFIVAPFKLAFDFITKGWSGLSPKLQIEARAIFNVISWPWRELWKLVSRIYDDISHLHVNLPVVGKVSGGGLLQGITGGIIHNIPGLASGGTVTAEGLVYLHAGETVTPARQAHSGPLVVFSGDNHFNEPVDVDLMSKRLEFALSAGLPV